MGLLKKIKNIFGNTNKEEADSKSQEEVSSDKNSVLEIESTLIKRDKEIQEYLDKSVNEMYNKILPIIDKLDQDINALDKKDVSSIRDDPRLKHITEVGRKEFLTQSMELKEKLMRRKTGEEAILYINAEIKKFIKYSRGSYFKTTQLIGEEAKRVKDDINEIIKIEESLIEESLKKIRPRDEIKVVLKSIEDFKAEKDKIKDFELKIKEGQGALSSRRKRISDIDGEIEKIKRGKEFEEIEKTSNELKNREELQGRKENEVRSLIDSKIIEKNLYYELDKRKVKLMEEYIKSSVDGLLNDPELLIYEVLGDTRKRIEKGEIGLKDPEKIIKKLEVDKKALLELQKSLKDLDEQIAVMKNKLQSLNLGLDKFRQEKSELLDKIKEEEINMNSLLKKKQIFEGEIVDKEKRIKLEFSKIF